MKARARAAPRRSWFRSFHHTLVEVLMIVLGLDAAWTVIHSLWSTK